MKNITGGMIRFERMIFDLHQIEKFLPYSEKNELCCKLCDIQSADMKKRKKDPILVLI